jgi:hypothetical protein
MVEDIYHNLYVLAANKLLVSEDEGVNWNTKSVPYSRVLASDYSGRIYLDLRYSTDKGSTWVNLPNSGFLGGFNYDIEINQSNRIYAASTSGIFYGEADSIVVSVENIEPVKTFSLSQNYPNPFNSSTVISYQLSVSGMAKLKVYDVLGNEVAILVDEMKSAGTHQIEFNAAGLSSGIYYYTIQAGSFIETKKMILMK